MPGYLIVTPKVPASSLAALDPDALKSLGPTLASVTRAIEEVLHPERIYCAFFGEQEPKVHFHLFPRTAWLASEYRKAHPEEMIVSGPLIIDWARRKFTSPIPNADSSATLSRIRECLTGS